jgi:hypothetical protein
MRFDASDDRARVTARSCFSGYVDARPSDTPLRHHGYGEQAGVVLQEAQVVDDDVTFVQICTPAAPLPATVQSRTSFSMHGQLELPVLSL